MNRRFARCSFSSYSVIVVFNFLISGLLASLLSPHAFAEEKTRHTPHDSAAENKINRPELRNSDLRSHWRTRGRTAPVGQSAATLYLKAQQQKLAMRAAARRRALPATTSGIPWVPLGPAPLISDQNIYGAASGRVTAVAIDPSDTTGNTVYAASSSGGVWKSTNAAATSASAVTWNALTDQQASLVNGAVSVKSDGSVVLVGTGEPDSAPDSDYGIGILRSTDHGGTWRLIPTATGNTPTLSFAGLGFAKFAWGTSGTVVAATGTTAEGIAEGDITSTTTRGLYSSNDSGQTWTFQVPTDAGVAISPASVSASDVVYDAVAGQFIASIRDHGLYTSPNGTAWTRMANQPAPLSAANCPATDASTCPIDRGQLAVVKGRDEIYFWFFSVDQSGTTLDQGIWRSINGAPWVQIDETGIPICGDPGNNGCGVEQGYYNLEIAAVPNGQATDLYAGAVNLFKCELTGGTVCSTLDPNFPNQWINLTHAYGCSSIAGVHPGQHGLDSVVAGGKALMYFGNDGGIYRTLDGFTQLQSGSCGTANGFDNLNSSSIPNGTIGSLAQLISFSLDPSDPNVVLGGTEGNGSPATASATTNPQWNTVNGGDGGYTAINAWTPAQWFTANPYVNIYMCPSGVNCTTDAFSLTVGSAEVGGDSGAFDTPYILDPQNANSMLVGTCRVWRGMPTVPPSPFSPLSVDFDTLGSNTCTGDEINLVSALSAGGPTADYLSTTVYATTEGIGPNASTPSGGEVWVTTNAGIAPMVEVTGSINPSRYTISSVALDAGDATGATAYIAIMGFLGSGTHIWKTTSAGTNWAAFGSTATGLPDAPVNALLVDTTSTSIYAATDVGLFVSSTAAPAWTEVGTPATPGGASGYLPNAPVSAVRLFNSGGTKKLRVSTYGRGIWEYALSSAPDFANAISNTPLTVFANQNAVFNGTLTTSGGYASLVNLSCSGNAPSTCTPSPAQATPTAAYTITAAGSVGDYSFNAHAIGTDPQAVTHDAALLLHVVDFNLTAPAPNSLSVPQGGTSNSSTFQVSAAGAFAGSVVLSCGSGLPAGATCMFSPSNTVNPTAANPVTVTMMVTAGSSTPVGGPNTVTLAATVAGAPAAKTQTFKFTVTGAAPDFALAVTATPAASVAGQNVAWNGTLTALHGYQTNVSLSCTGAAPGTCSVSPSSLVPAASGTAFTVTAGSPTTGSFTFNIQATDGTLTHALPVNLAVGTDVTWSDTGSNAQTVEAGASATYNFSAAPSGGSTFTGAVNFVCENLPPLTGCSFSPASIAAGAGATPVTLTISTTGPYDDSLRRRTGRSRATIRGERATGRALPLECLLAMPIAGVLFAGWARRKSEPQYSTAGICIALACLGALASCGGALGGGGGTQPPVSVSVSPRSVSLYANQPGNTWATASTHQQFSATVTGGTTQNVTWAVTGGDANGTIDANGLYTSPTATPSPSSVTVTATSSQATASATVDIEAATSVGTASNIRVTATAAGGSEHWQLVSLTVD